MSHVSYIEYDAECPFPIQNLPWGVFSTQQEPTPRVGVAVGSYVLDMAKLSASIPLPVPASVFERSSLNAYIAHPRSTWNDVRTRLQHLLDADTPELRDNADLRAKVFVPLSAARMHLPIDIGDYTDFYASREHAYNCGVIIRGKDNALQPNWTHLPVGYHGRASTVVPSGTALRRPNGQRKAPTDTTPTFGPSTRVDYELEMGYVIGGATNELGEPVSTEDAPERLFGMVILNDWSSRDIQTWEYVPLGPFLSKNFGSTISPWIVEMAALEPFAQPPPKQDPEVLPYLKDPKGKAYDVKLKVEMKAETQESFSTVATSNLKHIYWTPNQFVAHHTITGCTLRAGDLFGTGTLSAPGDECYGSLLEKSWAGQRPFKVGDVERTWIEDGDEIRMSAWCEGEGYRIGFGEAVGKILPALQL